MKKIFAIITLMMVSACANTSIEQQKFAIPSGPKYGPPAYVEGWRDGCQTGATAYGSSYIRSVYQTSVQGDKMQDPNYNKGWELGQQYCSYYTSSYLSNTEFHEDLRQKNTWFEMSSDGYFSYAGLDKIDFLPFERAE